MKSSKEWHQQNKQVLRAGQPTSSLDGESTYVPTEDDVLETQQANDREMSRKRQDLRNNHPFLSKR